MAMTLAGAWMWSGVETSTASKCLSSFSNILRKSKYFFALGKRPAAALSVFSSTSQRATMFSPARLPKSAPRHAAGADGGDVQFLVQSSPADKGRGGQGQRAPLASEVPRNRRRVKRMESDMISFSLN